MSLAEPRFESLATAEIVGPDPGASIRFTHETNEPFTISISPDSGGKVVIGDYDGTVQIGYSENPLQTTTIHSQVSTTSAQQINLRSQSTTSQYYVNTTFSFAAGNDWTLVRNIPFAQQNPVVLYDMPFDTTRSNRVYVYRRSNNIAQDTGISTEIFPPLDNSSNKRTYVTALTDVFHKYNCVFDTTGALTLKSGVSGVTHTFYLGFFCSDADHLKDPTYWHFAVCEKVGWGEDPTLQDFTATGNDWFVSRSGSPPYVVEADASITASGRLTIEGKSGSEVNLNGVIEASTVIANELFVKQDMNIRCLKGTITSIDTSSQGYYGPGSTISWSSNVLYMTPVSGAQSCTVGSLRHVQLQANGFTDIASYDLEQDKKLIFITSLNLVNATSEQEFYILAHETSA